MATPTFRSAMSTASATCSVSLMPLLSLSGMALFGVDSRLSPPPPGGVIDVGEVAAKAHRRAAVGELVQRQKRGRAIPPAARRRGVVGEARGGAGVEVIDVTDFGARLSSSNRPSACSRLSS